MITRITALVTGHWQLIALTALVFALWPYDIMAPVRILVVFFHEAAHAGMTLLTGGSVVEFTVAADESGRVVSRGGSRFWTLTAGYLGSLLIGVVLLLTAIRSTLDRWTLGALATLILLITTLYSRDPYPLIFGLATGAAFLATAVFLRAEFSDLILRIIGLASMIYVPFDIFSDTIKRAHLRSDAFMLAEEFGGTTTLWGGLWLALSILTIGLTLRFGLGDHSNISFRPTNTDTNHTT